MEDVLDIYELPYDPLRPVICFDEKPFQLLGDTLVPIPMKPGRCYLYDYHYERKGIYNILIAFEPLTGWRFVKVTKQRTKKDYALFMKELVDNYFPNVEHIKLIQDNLNTHNASSFYENFEPLEAWRLKNMFKYHYTPKGASWLNMVEIELSAFSKQYLNRRIPEQEILEQIVNMGVKERNQKQIKVNWRFTTNDARIKLKRHYPTIKN